jgi:polysaccharide pyruvyl transferase CsaB
MFYAQGIGPLRRRSARIMTRIVADRVERITVRDPASAELLRDIGVRRSPIAVTADPAFALRPAPREMVDGLIREAGGDPDRPFIGISIRPWHSGADVEVLAEAAIRIADETGMPLLFLPMQPPGDLEISRRVAEPLGERAVIIEKQVSTSEAVGIVSRAQALVAMRLHALIFGAATGVPIVGLAYDPKVDQLMEMSGQASACIPLNSLSAERVSAAVLAATAQGESQRIEYRSRSAALRERALENVDHALLAIKPAL